jgi:enamine deaminase RidA (YjgF/YER057c/UK114 family)
MSKPSREFINPKALSAPPGYSHVAKVNKGTMIYLAGQVPCDASGKLVGAGNVEAQAEQVYRNIKVAIEAAGGSMADIVKLTTYILAEVDPANITKLRAVRDRHVNVAHPPASTLLYISRLAQPGWLIEIEAVAAIGE